jgi:oligoribonuclease
MSAKEYTTPDRLVWVDIETTGLDPEEHLILEVALVVTDANLVTLAEWSGVRGFVSTADVHELNAMYGDTLAMHTESGLLAEVLASEVTEFKLEEAANQFLEDQGLEFGRSPMCGSSVAFDRAFLSSYMGDLAKWFHYRNFDASTVATFTRMLRPDIEFPPRVRRHRALDDVRRSIEIVRTCRDALGGVPPKFLLATREALRIADRDTPVFQQAKVEIDAAEAERVSLRAQLAKAQEESSASDIETCEMAERLKQAQHDAVTERGLAEGYCKELVELRALLASGQVVDLARVTDEEILVDRLGGLKWPDVHDVRALRTWLIEKAGVKA